MTAAHLQFLLQLLKLMSVTTNDQASTTASVSTATQAVPTLKPAEAAREQPALQQAVSQQESVVANHEAVANQARTHDSRC